jgi:GT2 family glycosyltransferase
MYMSLRETLPLGLNYEIIFIDDASTDGTRAWLAGLADTRVKVIFNHLTLGYAKANNKAIAIAHGEVIGLLNNDLVFSANWLEPMLDILDSPLLKAGIVGNVQVRIVDGSLDHVGIELTLDAKLEHLKHPQATVCKTHLKTFALTGACCLIKKETLALVQGLSEEYLNGCEDVDLCLKLEQRGLHSYVALNSTIGHHVSLTRGVNGLQNETNSLILQKKWRVVLKRELCARWYQALSDQATNVLQEHFDGEFLSAVYSAPAAAAALIAENMLLRNEYQWARFFKQNNLNDDDGIQITCTGLTPEPNSEYLVASEVIRLTTRGVKNARNFCAFGHRVENAQQSKCHITVTINNLQRKTFDVTTDRSFILNIEKLLLLQEDDNHLKITFEQTQNIVEPSSQLLGTSPLLFTHFMLDKRSVYFPESLTV